LQLKRHFTTSALTNPAFVLSVNSGIRPAFRRQKSGYPQLAHVPMRSTIPKLWPSGNLSNNLLDK
ncbi:MAG: hypothetical protein ACRD4Q_12060, partial [Candidatus Acidiferrales bacterium]